MPKKIENFLTDKWGILPIPGQFTMQPEDLEKAWNKLQGDLRSNKLQIEDAGGGIYSESEEEDQSEMSTAAPWTHNRQGSVSSQLSDYRPGRKTASIDEGDSDEEEDQNFTLEKLQIELEKILPPAPHQPVLQGFIDFQEKSESSSLQDSETNLQAKRSSIAQSRRPEQWR